MPLILVIVADPHEAAQLATLIQGRLSVDLVQAAEVGEGLLALEDRIPDLILTSPLMSPFDDGVLDEYLRDLGPAGAHVQTLRIPVLSQAPKKTKRLGFSLRRRAKPEAPTDGCEPKVFADEIEQYLARAAEEKRRVESNDQPVVVERQTATAEQEIAEERWTAAYSEDEPPANASWSAPEPVAETVDWRADLLDKPPVEEEIPIDQPSPAAYEETPVSYESPVQEPAVAAPYASVETEYEPVETEYEPVASASEYEQSSVEAIAESTIEPESMVPGPVVEKIVEPEAAKIEEPPAAVAAARPRVSVIDEDKSTPSFKAALAAIRAAWGKPPRNAESPIAVANPPATATSEPAAATSEPSVSFEVDLTTAVDVLDQEASDAPAPPANERKAAESAPSSGADINGDRRKKGKRPAKSAKSKPVRLAEVQPQAAQNEWGIFDPSQCGFAALVDKLDEVADEKTERQQSSAKTRVISLS